MEIGEDAGGVKRRICTKTGIRGPQRRPGEGGALYKSLSQLDEWIPAFAGMTLRCLAEACNFDFFTRSFEGMTVCSLRTIETAPDGRLGLSEIVKTETTVG
jgi:hypothetical protein